MNLLLRLSTKVSANVLPPYLAHIFLQHKCIGQCTVDGLTVECWELEGLSISSCSSQNTNHLAEMGSSSKFVLIIQDFPNHIPTSPESCLPPEHSPRLDQTFLPLMFVIPLKNCTVGHWWQQILRRREDWRNEQTNLFPNKASLTRHYLPFGINSWYLFAVN